MGSDACLLKLDTTVRTSCVRCCCDIPKSECVQFLKCPINQAKNTVHLYTDTTSSINVIDQMYDLTKNVGVLELCSVWCLPKWDKIGPYKIIKMCA